MRTFGTTALAGGLLLGALASATGARAEVGFELEFTGYSDLFKECEYSIWLTAPDDFNHVVLGYSVSITGKGIEQCEVHWGPDRVAETSCASDAHIDYTCEDEIILRPTSLDCYGPDDMSTDCGPVSLTGPEGAFVFE